MIWEILFGRQDCGQKVESASPFHSLDLHNVDFLLRRKIEQNECLRPEEVREFKRQSWLNEHIDYRLRNCND